MKDSACFIGHRKISDTPRCSRFGVRSSRFVIAKPCNGCVNPFSFKGRRILSRLPLLRCPKVVIRLEREQLLTAAPAVARFFLHRSESNVTQNDKPFTYFRFHFCNVRYSASIFCFYANGLLYRCKRCLCF